MGANKIEGEINMTKLVNLTPHTVNIISGDGSALAVPNCGTIARCVETQTELPSINVDGAEVSIVTTTYGDVSGLPEPEEGTYYIVSLLVAQAVKGRNDLLSPGLTIRDEAGQVIGCKALTRHI